MQSLWFIVPVHGRLPLASICLRQLRRTCDALTDSGIMASAVVVSEQDALDLLRPDKLGFATVRRDNQFLGRRFNDGIQLATDQRFNHVLRADSARSGIGEHCEITTADYVVPLGSDDWVDHRLFLDLPPQDTVVGFQRISVVREDGEEMVTANLNYLGGSGIRIIPRQVVARLGYRPADEDRRRACDTSILTNIRLEWQNRGREGIRIEHRHLHDAQIVDWKSPTDQLNPYDSIARIRQCSPAGDPFEQLADIYPAEALTEMAGYYATLNEAVAA